MKRTECIGGMPTLRKMEMNRRENIPVWMKQMVRGQRGLQVRGNLHDCREKEKNQQRGRH